MADKAESVNKTTNPITVFLAGEINSYAENRGVNHSEIARLAGISSSSISRIVNFEGLPETENIARLCRLLDLSLTRVLSAGEAVVYYPEKPLPEIVAEFLEKDKNLLPGGARVIAEVFRSAYSHYTSGREAEGAETTLN